ncbi:MAG: aspartate carbamoyltransferase regulatory subunit [Oscillospiraceae bacterium]|nr:aspartate carbamoyltransferase regulatory subunit [Oscillospiraceae bacterium]
MNVDSIKNGVVIDHITPGGGMRLYELLKLDSLDVPVALMKNVQSRKMGKKDILKIDADIPIDLDVIAFAEPGATVNIIRDGRLLEKRELTLPRRLVNVVRCLNPRCISATEQELDQIFLLTDPENKVYRCLYCETRAKK